MLHDEMIVCTLHEYALCFHFYVCQFLLQNVLLKLINILVLFVFILNDAFGFILF